MKIGSPFDEANGREVMRRLWQTGRFDDVAVESEAAPGGLAVVFRVTPKRTVASVFVSGDADPDAFHLGSGSVYDAVAIVSAKRALLDLEHKNGNLDATLDVSSAFADVDKRAIDVCIKLVRGPRIAIESIKIHGSAFDSELTSNIAKDDTTNVVGAIVDEDYLQRDELLIAAALYDHGLLSHTIKRTTERHGAGIAIDFAITDGIVYRYGNIDVKGDLLAAKTEYTKLLPAKHGDVFNRASMVAAIEKMRALHKTLNREDVTIEPSTELDPSKGVVDIAIRVDDPQKHAPQLAIVDITLGHGRVVAKGDTVSVHYKGTLTNGTVFDDSHGRAPFEFHVGGGQVIAGFDRGVTGMKVGGKRRITIPPDLAYGARATGNIPASSTLVFEIELLSIR